MVGTITFTDSEGTVVVATLGDDYRWATEPPGWEEILNSAYPPPERGYSPEDGIPGVRQLNAANADLRGELAVDPTRRPSNKPPPDGLVF